MIKANNKSCFLYQGFLSQTLIINRTAVERRDHILFFSTTSSRSRTTRHLFATLAFICMWHSYHVFLITSLETYRLLLSEIYDLNVLPFIWLINDGMLNFQFLYSWFLLQQSDLGKWGMWTCFNCYSCIISEPTNQVS